MISDPNYQIGPNDAQILSSELCIGIAEWFKQNTYFKNRFKTIVNYLRQDFPLMELPGISVYHTDTPSQEVNSWNEVGKVAIDVVFSIGPQREKLAAFIIRTMETIRGNFLTNPTYIQKYLSAHYVPGLIKFGVNTNFQNLGNLKQMINNSKNSTITITFTCSYEINVLLNQRAAWRKGKDYFSPEDDIYTEVGGINNVEIIIKEKTLDG